ncbi:MAG: hypothetical protein KDI46_03035 [Alphaproteobacteria bacterium]|nr:hypothetical protein [Alphaproteobacteria bacterium]
MPPSCDSDFYDVLSARAWTSAKREVETAETLIVKPDSVMEYTCFTGRIAGYGTGVANTHLANNFSHKTAGGLGGAGACEDMADIWELLKCKNFDAIDFRTFTELEGADPRTFPAACAEAGRAGKWAANNVAATPASGAAGGMETLVTFMDAIKWSVGANANNCNGIEPIATGVMADRDGEDGPDVPYPDKVCSIPSCYFDPGNLAAAADDKCKP